MQFVDSKTKKKAPLFIVNMKHSSCTQMSLSNQATFCWSTWPTWTHDENCVQNSLFLREIHDFY